MIRNRQCAALLYAVLFAGSGLVATVARADGVAMPPVVTCCPLPGQAFGAASFEIVVCNLTNFPAKYTYQVTSPTAGAFVTPAFAAETPVIQPGKCMEFSIEVFCPLSAPSVALVATVQNLSTQLIVQTTSFAAPTQLIKAQAKKGPFEVIVDPVAGPLVLPVPTPVMFLNDLMLPIAVGLEFDTIGPLIPPNPIAPIVIPPESGLGIELIPQAVIPGNITTEGVPPAPLPPDFAYLIIKWDDDGDGFTEPHLAVAYRLVTLPPPPCPTDLNGDGVVNGGDISNILNGFGQTCP